jgi:hypothetical protein
VTWEIMKMRKSAAVLACAAILVSAGVQAAERPAKNPAPVESVRNCPTHGAGFFSVPGSETCARIGGQARYDYGYRHARAREISQTGSRATGRTTIDARTPTEYGMLRTFVRYDVQRRTGTLR